MKVQLVSKYLTLAQEGLVPQMDCPVDQGLLMCNEDLDQKIFLYCLSCSYKKFVGIDFYNKLESEVNKSLSSIKMDGSIEYGDLSWKKNN